MMVAACDNRKKTVAPAPPAPRQTHRAAIASASARTRPPHPGRGASPGPWRRAGHGGCGSRPRCCEAAAAHNLTTAGHRIAGPATRGAPRSSRRRAAARVRRLLATPKCPIPLSQFPSFRRVRGDFRGGWCSQVGTHKLVFSSMNTQTRKHLKGAWESTLHARACERPA